MMPAPEQTDVTIEVLPVPSDLAFPTIDIKLRNTGSTTRMLRKFCIDVEKVGIDPTPALVAWVSGQHTYRDGDGPGRFSRFLQLMVSNGGAGPARDAEIVLEGHTLNALFPVEARTFVVTLPKHQQAPILLDADKIPPQAFEAVQRELAELDRQQSESEASLRRGFKDWLRIAENRNTREVEDDTRKRYRVRDKDAPFVHSVPQPLNEAIEYQRFLEARATELARRWLPTGHISLEKLWARYRMSSADGGVQRGHFDIDLRESGVYLHRHGFALHHSEVTPKRGETVFCTIIDVDRGPHRREFPIDRLLINGHRQTLSFVVGATESAAIRMKLAFETDDGRTIGSKPFDVKLWTPSNVRRLDTYVDGVRHLKQVRGLERQQAAGEKASHLIAKLEKRPDEFFPFRSER